MVMDGIRQLGIIVIVKATHTTERLGDEKLSLTSVLKLELSFAIGRVSLARENEAGGSWGQEVHILHVNV